MNDLELLLPEWVDDIRDLLEINGLVDDTFDITSIDNNLPISICYRFELSNGDIEFIIEHTNKSYISNSLGGAYRYADKSLIGVKSLTLVNGKYKLFLKSNINKMYHYEIHTFNYLVKRDLYIPIQNKDIIIYSKCF